MDVQKLKGFLPMVWIEDDSIWMDVRDVHVENAQFPIIFMDDGIIIDRREVHPSNV